MDDLWPAPEKDLATPREVPRDRLWASLRSMGGWLIHEERYVIYRHAYRERQTGRRGDCHYRQGGLRYGYHCACPGGLPIYGAACRDRADCGFARAWESGRASTYHKPSPRQAALIEGGVRRWVRDLEKELEGVSDDAPTLTELLAPPAPPADTADES
jgi:hypothetical protein